MGHELTPGSTRWGLEACAPMEQGPKNVPFAGRRFGLLRADFGRARFAAQVTDYGGSLAATVSQ
jgi:hypothetical protein